MAHYFFSDPPHIILCVGIGIDYTISVKLKFCAQLMYQIYIIKYCILLNTSQNKNELTGTSVAFTMIVSRFEKSHCLLKSSVPLPSNRSNKQIHDTDKRPSSILLAFYGHVISNMAYMPQIFHPQINYFVVENG